MLEVNHIWSYYDLLFSIRRIVLQWKHSGFAKKISAQTREFIFHQALLSQTPSGKKFLHAKSIILIMWSVAAYRTWDQTCAVEGWHTHTHRELWSVFCVNDTLSSRKNKNPCKTVNAHKCTSSYRKIYCYTNTPLCRKSLQIHIQFIITLLLISKRKHLVWL